MKVILIKNKKILEKYIKECADIGVAVIQNPPITTFPNRVVEDINKRLKSVELHEANTTYTI